MEQKLTERQSSNSTVKKSSHHSQHRRHRSSRHKRNYFWYYLTKPFRKKEKVSGVRVNQQMAETRIMVIFTVSAVLLLYFLIPFVTWLLETLSDNPGI